MKAGGNLKNENKNRAYIYMIEIKTISPLIGSNWFKSSFKENKDSIIYRVMKITHIDGMFERNAEFLKKAKEILDRGNSEEKMKKELEEEMKKELLKLMSDPKYIDWYAVFLNKISRFIRKLAKTPITITPIEKEINIPEIVPKYFVFSTTKNGVPCVYESLPSETIIKIKILTNTELPEDILNYEFQFKFGKFISIGYGLVTIKITKE